MKLASQRKVRSLTQSHWHYQPSWMKRAMAMVTYCLFAVLIEKILESEREKVRVTLGHEPTQRNLQYYFDLRQEEKNSRNTRQWEIDCKKLRRLVFGEDDSNSKAS